MAARARARYDGHADRYDTRFGALGDWSSARPGADLLDASPGLGQVYATCIEGQHQAARRCMAAALGEHDDQGLLPRICRGE